MSASEYPRRHFGRRKGWKLRPHQAGLLQTMLPRLLLKPQPGLDPRHYFEPATSEVWLEVGFGGGEHLAAQAKANPHAGIIGAEPFVAGMAKLLARIEHEELSNIRLYTEDAREVMRALPDATLSRVFILFPDPWPKTRHHKRRLIQMETLDELARVMRPGAALRFATDDPGYISYALERFIVHSGFGWKAAAPADWRTRSADWPETRYEAKAKRAGRACAYLEFTRMT